jgi:DNA processing protein
MKAEMTITANDVQRLRPADALYPQRVLEVPGRARVLRALGDLDVLNAGPLLAVVGTRKANKDILSSTRRVVELAQEFEMVIVSGISPGVDVAAHEAAMEFHLRTIAVPGCGLDALMKTDRADVAHRIVEDGGLLLSPFPSSSPETSERRFWRNRVIAALCHGLVMVASESGGGAEEAQRWARQLERWIIEPTEEPSEEPAEDTA